MSRTREPPAGDRQAARRRAAARQFELRQRRGRRELTALLQERYQRENVPARDEGPPPRID